MAIDANRQALIKSRVLEARIKELEFAKEITSETKDADIDNFSISIFGGIEDLTDEEKRFAYEKYAEITLDSYDKDNNNEVTVDEFTEKRAEEYLDLAKKDTKETNEEILPETVEKAEREANLLAQNLDIDGDGKISKTEFTYFQMKADACADSADKEGVKDGNISNFAVSSLEYGLKGKNAQNEEYHAVIQKYLEGDNLSDIEKEILKQSSEAIRKKAQDDALNVFGLTGIETPAPKEIYKGDISTSSSVVFEDKAPVTLFTDYTQIPKVSFEDRKDEYTISGLGTQNNTSPFQWNNPYANMSTNPYQAPKPSKSFAFGNIMGSLFSGALMLRNIFGGGGFRWWF